MGNDRTLGPLPALQSIYSTYGPDPRTMTKPAALIDSREELANALTHGLGATLALAGGAVLITLAARYGDAWQLIGATVTAWESLGAAKPSKMSSSRRSNSVCNSAVPATRA